MAIVPVFWVWWMRHPQFTPGEIRFCRIWSLVYLAALVTAAACCGDGYLAAWSLQSVALRLTAVLGVWWLVRMTGFWKLCFVALLMVDAIAVTFSLGTPIAREFELANIDLGYWVLVFPAVVAVFHLLIATKSGE